MESCSTLPTVIILTSVGWEVKRITLPPTDRPSKNSDKNTPLYGKYMNAVDKKKQRGG